MAEQKQAIQPNTKVLAQFIRDLSFENILAQKGLDTNTPPDIKVLVNLDAKKRKSEKGEEVNDELVLGVISSYVKKMAKAVDEYKSLGEKGEEMANKIQFEIDFLTTYLPEQLSEEEVEKIVDDVLAELGDVDMSQMGRVIGAVMAKGDGIDGSIVSKIVKGKLS